MHFNFKQGLFQAKGEILQYIGEDGKEYVPYDYNFEEDIVPAINNLIPGNEKLPIRRELKNIKVFLQGSLVGLCFKGFDFGDVVAAGALFSATARRISAFCILSAAVSALMMELTFRRQVSDFMTVCLKKLTMCACETKHRMHR